MKRKRHPERLDTICAVIPCYNAEDTCAAVIEELHDYVELVIAVNDGSTDGTAKALAETDASVISHRRNRGKGVALMTGFKRALEDRTLEAIITIDADLQHKPTEIPKLMEALPTDLIIGNRFHRRVPNQPLKRRLSNAFSNRVLSFICSRPILDSQSGFRVYSRRLADYLIKHAKGKRFEWETEAIILAARADFSIVFVPISTHYPDKLNSSFHPIWDALRVVAQFIK